jgi:hypothetical protein
VVPLAVVLSALRVIESASIYHSSVFRFTSARYEVTPFWNAIQTMYWWHDASLRANCFAILIGFSFWALHQGLRAGAFTLQRMRPTSCA